MESGAEATASAASSRERMLRRRAEVTCQEMEVLHRKVKAAMQTEDSTILTLESMEKRLRDRFTTQDKH